MRVTQIIVWSYLPYHADLNLPPGEGDKRVLRRALQLVGMPLAAARVKRAIQFGSRIGWLSNTREFGSNRAANKAKAGSVAIDKVPGTGPKPPRKVKDRSATSNNNKMNGIAGDGGAAGGGGGGVVEVAAAE